MPNLRGRDALSHVHTGSAMLRGTSDGIYRVLYNYQEIPDSIPQHSIHAYVFPSYRGGPAFSPGPTARPPLPWLSLPPTKQTWSRPNSTLYESRYASVYPVARGGQSPPLSRESFVAHRPRNNAWLQAHWFNATRMARRIEKVAALGLARARRHAVGLGARRRRLGGDRDALHV